MKKLFNVLTFDIFTPSKQPVELTRIEPSLIGEKAFNILRQNRDYHRAEIVRLRDEIEYLQQCLEQHEMAEVSLIKACDAHVIKEKLPHTGGIMRNWPDSVRHAMQQNEQNIRRKVAETINDVVKRSHIRPSADSYEFSLSDGKPKSEKIKINGVDTGLSVSRNDSGGLEKVTLTASELTMNADKLEQGLTLDENFFNEPQADSGTGTTEPKTNSGTGTAEPRIADKIGDNDRSVRQLDEQSVPDRD